MKKDYDAELKAAIDVLEGMQFKQENPREVPPESLTKSTLIVMAKQILREFNRLYVPQGEFIRVVGLCNRIIGFWGEGKKIPIWLKAHLDRLKDSSFPPKGSEAFMKNEEIKHNCLNLIEAFIRTYEPKKVKV